MTMLTTLEEINPGTSATQVAVLLKQLKTFSAIGFREISLQDASISGLFKKLNQPLTRIKLPGSLPAALITELTTIIAGCNFFNASILPGLCSKRRSMQQSVPGAAFSSFIHPTSASLRSPCSSISFFNASSATTTIFIYYFLQRKRIKLNSPSRILLKPSNEQNYHHFRQC